MTVGELHADRTGRGRDAAYVAVRDVLRQRDFAARALHTLRSAEGLAGRDAALAMEIALGTVRHLLTIEHVLSAVAQFDPQRVRYELRAILYTAACQIIWMDRVPVFAAVDEAVEQARRYVGGRSPGMVNAVLRGLTRALGERRVPWERLSPRQVRVGWDTACAFERDVLPPAEKLSAHLAAATGERVRRYETLVTRFGAEDTERAAWAAGATPVIALQRNPLRGGAEELTESLHAAFGPEIEIAGDTVFVTGAASIVAATPFADGRVFVQDTTARAAARAVEAQPGEKIVDLCAAPGGKAMALAIDMEDRGELWACDIAADRLERVRENVQRLGLNCVRAQVGPPAEGEFDAALLDVPCANTGVLARRPEARLSLNAEKLTTLTRTQRELLDSAAKLVRPGGRLVYSTCSLEPEENEEQIRRFLADHADWRLAEEHTTLPAWGPRLADWRDGGYVARLERGSTA
ncbi:MAG: transcription antitermination factor NusB [Phycisphaerae bacterium]|jgi:16S rRNA (cytosine967-C5)-methyltransferase